jgi:hypothetical protein
VTEVFGAGSTVVGSLGDAITDQRKARNRPPTRITAPTRIQKRLSFFMMPPVRTQPAI